MVWVLVFKVDGVWYLYMFIVEYDLLVFVLFLLVVGVMGGLG